MLKRHWIAATTAGLALLIAFSVGGYILGWGLGVDAGEKQANTDTYAKHAQDEIERTCGRLNGAAYTECIVGVVEATNEHERSESDLKAQRNMARWALLMLLATIVMAVVTSLGVYYVWRTLNATKEMAKDTREIGEAQVRAYVDIRNVVVTPQKRMNCLNISFEFHNTGASPAKDLNYTFLIVLYRATFKERPPVQYSRENTVQYPNFPRNGDLFIRASGSRGINHAVTNFRFTEYDVRYFEDGSLWAEVAIATSFKDVFGVEIRDFENFFHLGGLAMGQPANFYPGMTNRHSMADDQR